MKTYGKQRYTENQAARAYANNHLNGTKTRVVGDRVQMMRDAKWVDVGSTQVLAEKWAELNPRDR